MFCTRCGKQVPQDSKFCVFCGSTLTSAPIRQAAPVRSVPQAPTITSKKTPVRKAQRIGCTISVALCLTAVLFLIMAMNFQDILRNTQELVNPTAVYTLLLCILLAFSAVSLICLWLRNHWVPAFVSLLLPMILLFAVIQGSVFASSYELAGELREYINADAVGFCNTIWVSAMLVTVAASFLPALTDVFRRYTGTDHSTNPYDTIARLHGYYRDGILTKEEFEKAKRDILQKSS